MGDLFCAWSWGTCVDLGWISGKWLRSILISPACKDLLTGYLMIEKFTIETTTLPIHQGQYISRDIYFGG